MTIGSKIPEEAAGGSPHGQMSECNEWWVWEDDIGGVYQVFSFGVPSTSVDLPDGDCAVPQCPVLKSAGCTAARAASSPSKPFLGIAHISGRGSTWDLDEPSRPFSCLHEQAPGVGEMSAECYLQ